jgi:putative hydroxymethylpyrimidine transport system permease protein
MTEATHWQGLIHVRVPLALPSLLSGLRVSAPLAPLGAVVGEWVGASAGLGFIMVQANARMQTATVFVAMAILAVFSLLMRHAVDRLAPRLIPWASNQ